LAKKKTRPNTGVVVWGFKNSVTGFLSEAGGGKKKETKRKGRGPNVPRSREIRASKGFLRHTNRGERKEGKREKR